MLLYSSNPYSKGARLLARELGIRRIKHHNSRFSGRRNPYVINWGSTAIPLPWVNRVRLLNAPEAVREVSNKSLFFWLMEDTGLTPPHTYCIDEAKEWIENGKSVVERHVLNGHGGVGIRIVDEINDLSEAPLYVEYVKKKAEFRIHMFQDQDRAGVRIIDIQQKIRRNDQEPLDWKVRSYANGFMYVRQDIRVPQGICEAARQCMSLTDLHFGAADVIYNEHQDKAYVLEINTAPGLEGQTVHSYAQAFRRIGR